jgi:demethylmenaquinone methyltransferase/2-methoxy-6-polyprenyl-1,4-benzoquinol methylase
MPDVSRFARSLFAPLPARYDSLAEILSFHQNEAWRLAAVSAIARGLANGGQGVSRGADSADGAAVAAAGSAGADAAGGRGPLILDVASGTAGVAIELAKRTGGTVVGVDLTEQMLRQGTANVAASAVAGRILLVAGQAERLPFPDRAFDALAFSYLLRYVEDPQATLTELARVVKPGGVMASLEFCVPAGPVWHPAWLAYTRVLLPVGGLLTGGPAWWRVGRFLGPNISGHYRRYPVDWTVRAWEKAGFADVGTRRMSLGGGLVMWGTRASD